MLWINEGEAIWITGGFTAYHTPHSILEKNWVEDEQGTKATPPLRLV